MYACMYACMHACMHACMYVCMYVCMYIYIHIYIYIYIYIYTYIYISTCTPYFFTRNSCTCVYCTHTHTHTCMDAYIHTYILYAHPGNRQSLEQSSQQSRMMASCNTRKNMSLVCPIRHQVRHACCRSHNCGEQHRDDHCYRSRMKH